MNTYPTYEINVTPAFGPDLHPVYEASIYRMIPAGICGPFSEVEEFDSIEHLDHWLALRGFVRTGEFGPPCRNGFASAKIEKADEIAKAGTVCHGVDADGLALYTNAQGFGF